MIRFDGYYIAEPIIYQERREWKPLYSVIAYGFLKNGYVITVGKKFKSKEEVFFSKTDFNSKNNYDRYFLDNEVMHLLLYEKEPWEEKFYYDKISDEEFVSRQTGKSIKFVPWKKNE